MPLYYELKAVKEVKANPPSAIRSELNSKTNQIDQQLSRTALDSELKAAENTLRGALADIRSLSNDQSALATDKDLKQAQNVLQNTIMGLQRLDEKQNSLAPELSKIQGALKNDIYQLKDATK